MKVCTKCKGENPATLEFFPFAKRNKDKLSSWCRVCMRKTLMRYRRTTKGKVAGREYRQTEEYKRSEQKYRTTIRGHLKFIYNSMKQRCNNLNAINYKNYGGRGIRCLFKTLDNFRDYVIDVLCVDPRKLQIDRIDNNGNYEPGNIRFVTSKENNNNRRDNKNGS